VGSEMCIRDRDKNIKTGKSNFSLSQNIDFLLLEI